MFHLIGQLIFGLVVGIIARAVLPGREALPDGPLGWILTALVGVGGALVGSVIARSLWASENYTAGWIMSIIGAILLLLILRLLFGRGAGQTS